MKKWVPFVIVAIFSMMLVVNVCAGEEVNLVVGFQFDITGPIGQGGVATGWDDYLKYINEEKGGINGAKLLGPWVDDGNKSDKTIAWYRTLMGRKPEPVMFNVGHTTGAVVLKKLMEVDGISGYTVSAAGVAVFPPATLYGSFPTYQDQVAMFFDWILMNWKEKRKPRFGWISADNPWGREAAKSEVKAYAEKVGIEIVGEEYVPPIPIDSTLSVKRLIKDKKADFLWTNSDAATLIPILRDAQRLNLRKEVKAWGSHSFLDIPRLLGVARKDPTIAKALEGIFLSYAYTQMEEEDAPGAKFLRELSKKYQGGLPKEEIRGQYVYGVLVGNIVERVLRLVAEKVPVEKITKADIEKHGWWRMKDYNPMGLLGGKTLTYGKDLSRQGIVAGVGAQPLQIIGGKATRLKANLSAHGLP